MAAGTASGNHFERLGLPIRYAIEPAELESRYLALSAELHPDRFADDDDPARKLAAVAGSAAINEAYRTLKDPYSRAEYLLGLLGGPAADADKRTPPGFLEEMLMVREEVDDALSAGDLAGAEAMVPGFARRRDRMFADIAGRFGDIESARTGKDDARFKSRLAEIRSELNAVNYLRRIIQQIRDARVGRREM